ncbi:hypothetical protein HS1genome_1570 [Sulfodiicoccus acidiphilus]|uniref:Uncharacterized protein n=1 Tax=Sulfodiicoccus acidiphilus TaxID=1670455 RepID=A0A348B4S9_9CREN|nr:hypothetical protein [Sulfodiicoccus acidiphilus]BBD73181.1 hypothetical protein HS1genome_1570 [Sulfodiicoccus acidiphilus]GGU01346.1 hypothetical protein GCM10007116_18150 [Sulfodiicoccus acidiphilus]
MEVKDLVNESEEIALRVVRYEYRKAVGKYYLAWSTEPLIVAIFTSLLTSFDLPPVSYNFTPVLVVPYMVYSFYVFWKAMGVYGRIETRSTGLARRGNSERTFRPIFLGTQLLYALSFSLILVGDYSSHFLLALAGALLFAALFGRSMLYLGRMGGGVRHYDVLASVTLALVFAFLVRPEFYNQPLFPTIYLTFSVTWIYAGYMSLREVLEHE